MNFINYSDDEVKVFHPICEKAIRKALTQLKLDSDYEVRHHYRYQGIIPDFVIINRHTKSILIVIEVKRTPNQVMSTRYRLQAQSYVSNAASETFEQKYFMLTNLEKTYLFKYNTDNTSVINQIIIPSPINTGSFSDDQQIFEQNLASNYATIIKIAHDDSGVYNLNYDEILQELGKYTNDIENWHSAVTVIGYELIRSILQNYQPDMVSEWSNAEAYKRNPKVLQTLINSVDFASLGIGEILNSPTSPYWQTSILRKASIIGNRTYSGDEFASVVHELLVRGNEGEGIVPTDMELAAALAELVSAEYSDPKFKIYCDPASGSGNLLSAIIEKNQGITPRNIWANDNLEYLRDVLSIRLGLKFPSVISPDNAPKITSENIVNLNPTDFISVDAVVMNPPYVSGVRDSTRKLAFFNKIFQVNQKKATTNIGQMPLEGPFLELLVSFVKKGTVIGVIYPEQHLFGKGREATAIRNLLINEFGLKKIFTYPRTGLFESVVKGTVILIGERGYSQPNIEILNSTLPIERINLKDLVQNNNPTYGIEKSVVSRDELIAKVKVGWKSTMYPSYGTITEVYREETDYLDRFKYSRGPADNSGEGKYLYITKQEYWPKIKSLVPREWLKNGIQNVLDYDCDGLLIHNSKTVKALCPPPDSFIKGTKNNKLLLKIINIASNYINQKSKIGMQAKQKKTPQEIIDILETVTKKITPKGRLLVPRALRKNFKIFETSTDTIVSTNFIILNLNSSEKEVFSSWLMSIFGQIQLEMLSKPQEGLRKMEVGEIGLIKFPKNLSNISLPVINSHGNSRAFTDFSIESDTDSYWKEELNITEQNYLGLVNLMSKLIDLRNP